MSSTDLPYPPFELANRVLAVPPDGDPYSHYEHLGFSTRGELLNLLPDDYSFQGRRVLDFGCGAGRTLRHFLAEAETAEIWGADIDAPSVEWIERNMVPPLNVVRCEPEPPLPFDSGSFGLAWAISVFTHLPTTSADWLLELHRILEPGGLLMASYMGRWNAEVFLGEQWDEDRVGMMVLQHCRPWDDGGPMVLMSDWWVREHWGRAFEVVAINPRVHNQSWALLRKREVEISREELLAPGDDAREWGAMENQVRHLQREIEITSAESAAVAGLLDSHEGSLSWKLTEPLRAAKRALRGDA